MIEIVDKKSTSRVLTETLVFEASTAGDFEDISLGLKADTTYVTQHSFSSSDDDFADDITTTGVLPVDGTRVAGSLEIEGDRDWFAVTVETGETWTFNLFASDPALDPDLFLYTADGEQLAYNNDSPGARSFDGGASGITYNFFEAGTYYLSAGALGDDSTGQYNLSGVAVDTGDIIRGDINTTATLNIGSEVTGAIEYSTDDDWFAITIGVNEIVRFTSDRGGVGLGLGLFDAAGNAVEVEFGQNFVTREIVANNLDAGQYFLGVAGSFCFLQTSSGDYTIEASLISDDYSGDATTSGILAIGGNAAGVMNYISDEDWFAVTIEASQVVRFSGSDDIKLTLFDAAGNIVTTGVTSEDLIATNLEEGQYFLGVDYENFFIEIEDYTVEATLVENALTEDDDSYTGTAGGDEVFALGGNDTLLGLDGNDTLFGLDGNDLLNGGKGADILNGGTGVDTADYSTSSTGVHIRLTDSSFNTGEGAGDTFINIESLRGSNFDDELIGDIRDNGLSGGDGSDLIVGNIGDDIINGGTGNDRLFGERDDDRLDGGAGDDFLNGGSGDDILIGRSGDDILFDLTGDDILRAGDGDDVLLGGFGQDQLFGDSGSDELRGQSGEDFLVGGTGNDLLAGARDDDVLHGQDGQDLLYGGLNDDQLFGGEGDDELYGQENDDVLFGEGGDDFLVGGIGDDTLAGGAGDDVIYGSSGLDILLGGAGNDSLFGGGLNDELFGGAGNDILRGEGSLDVLNGGAGNDLLIGGTSTDRFVFDANNGADRILDFAAPEVIEINGSSFTSFADIQAAMVDNAAGNFVTITISAGNTIRIDGVQSSDLRASNFELDGTGVASSKTSAPTADAQDDDIFEASLAVDPVFELLLDSQLATTNNLESFALTAEIVTEYDDGGAFF